MIGFHITKVVILGLRQGFCLVFFVWLWPSAHVSCSQCVTEASYYPASNGASQEILHAQCPTCGRFQTTCPISNQNTCRNLECGRLS